MVFLVSAVQFINVLDFVMVMPLGPDFAAALGIPTSDIGILGGSYAASAAVSGIACSFFLDRFDRRKALAVALLGLVIGTALGGLASGMLSLVLARVVAGAFGGPATSLAFAIVTDAVPDERRGQALGKVMTAFSLATVFGVPAGLELSGLFGWRAPFFAVSGLGVVLCGAAVLFLPPMTAHMGRQRGEGGGRLLDVPALLSLSAVGLVMLGVFAVVPSLSPYVQHNLGYPREYLGVLYLSGGVMSFFAMRGAGILSDRLGAARVVWIGTMIHLAALTLGFFVPQWRVPIIVFFVLYMISGSVRMVPLQTLASRVPDPARRARYMSTQSAVQHVCSSLGAMGASFAMSAEPDGAIQGIERVAVFAFVVAALVPFLATRVEIRLRGRAALASVMKTT